MVFFPVFQSAKTLYVSQSASSLRVAAQPASSTGQPSKPIVRPVAPTNHVAAGSSVQHRPTVFLQHHSVSPINSSPAHKRKALAPDTVSFVRPIRSADPGHSSAVEALECPRENLARREEVFAALE